MYPYYNSIYSYKYIKNISIINVTFYSQNLQQMILINVDTIMNISIVNISNFYQKSMEIHTDYLDQNLLLGDQILYNYFLYFTGN